MKKIFLISYSLYLLAFLDSLQRHPVIGFSHTVIFFVYGLGLFILLAIGTIKNKKLFLTRSKEVIGVLIIYYIYMALHPGTYTYLLIISFLMLLIIYTNYRFIQIYHCLLSFIEISFIVPAIYMLLVCLSRNINLFVELSNVNLASMFTGIRRYRTDFGFYNINGTGNLMACTLCVSLFPIVMFAHRYKENNKRYLFSLAAMIVTDLFLASILLLSNSRNAIITVIISVVVYLYYALTENKPMSRATRYIFKLILILVFAVSVIVNFLPIISDMFSKSGRLNSLLLNIQALDSTRRILFGLGLISGYSGTIYMGHYMTTIDNYYLYTLVCGGIVGVCLMIWVLTKTGKRLHSRCHSNTLYYVCFANFVSLLVSGIGETCIFYPRFPSCIIYWSIFISLIDEEVDVTIIDCESIDNREL